MYHESEDLLFANTWLHCNKLTKSHTEPITVARAIERAICSKNCDVCVTNSFLIAVLTRSLNIRAFQGLAAFKEGTENYKKGEDEEVPEIKIMFPFWGSGGLNIAYSYSNRSY